MRPKRAGPIDSDQIGRGLAHLPKSLRSSNDPGLVNSMRSSKNLDHRPRARHIEVLVDQRVHDQFAQGNLGVDIYLGPQCLLNAFAMRQDALEVTDQPI